MNWRAYGRAGSGMVPFPAVQGDCAAIVGGFLNHDDPWRPRGQDLVKWPF
jgi:hypothetical protein